MNKFLLATTSIVGLLVMHGVPARADADLDARAKDPKQWVMQAGDNANTRYSKLKQITAANAGKLQVAWTFFRTGELPRHDVAHVEGIDASTAVFEVPDLHPAGVKAGRDSRTLTSLTSAPAASEGAARAAAP